MAELLDFAVKMNMMMSGAETFSQASGVIGKLQSSMEQLQERTGRISSYQKLQGNIETLSSKLNELRGKLSESSSAIQASREKSAGLKVEYDAAKKRLQMLTKEYPKNSEQVKKAKQALQELGSQYKAEQSHTRELEAEQAKLERQISRTESRMSEEQSKLREMGNALKDAGINTSNLSERQEKLQSALERSRKAQERLSSIQGQLTWDNMKGDMMGAIASVGALKIPVQVDMAFEQQMANVRAVMNPVQEEFDALRSQAMELGATTQFSATQAGSAQEILARGGFDVNSVMATMPSLLHMASAEGMELAQSAEIVMGALRGFSLEATEAKKITDILAYASSHSNTGIAEMGQAFSVVATTANQQLVSAEKLASYIGILANYNIKGSEAGNALKSMFMSLSSPAKEAQDVLNKYQIARRDTTGRMRDITEILRDLTERTAKEGPTGQLEAFKKVFGKNYGGNIISLAQGVMNGEQATLQQGIYSERNNAALNMSNVRNDTLQGDIVSLGSAWEGVMINVGHALEPINRFFTQTLTQGLTVINQFVANHETLFTSVVRIGSALASWKIISTAYKYGNLLVQLPFAKIGALLADGQAQALLTGENFSKLGSIFSGLTSGPLAILKSGFSGLWGIISAHPFMALFVAIELVYHNWENIVALWESGVNYVTGLWDKLSAWWEGFSIPNVFEPFLGIVSGLFGKIIEPFVKFAQYLSGFTLPDIFAPLTGMASSVVEGLKGIFTGLADWIMSAFSKLNPFNWELPSWLGGSSKQQVNNANAALGGYMPPEIKPHAKGGIFSRPHIGLVAEAGREAIIPLTNKSRGIPLLNQAAQILGVEGELSGGSSQSMTTIMNSLTGNDSGMSSIMNSFTGNDSGMSSIMNSLTGNDSGMTTIMNSLTGNDSGMSTIMNSLNGNDSGMTTIMNSLTGNDSGMTTIMNSLTGNDSGMSSIMNSLTGNDSGMTTIMNSLTGNDSGMTTIMNSLTGNDSGMSSIMNSFTGNDSGMSSIMNSFTGNDTQSMNTFMNTLTSNATNTLTGITGAITGAISTLMESITQTSSEVYESALTLGGRTSRLLQTSTTNSPQITVNVTGNAGESTGDLANDIAARVREVIAEMMSYEERVSYA